MIVRRRFTPCRFYLVRNESQCSSTCDGFTELLGILGSLIQTTWKWYTWQNKDSCSSIENTSTLSKVSRSLRALVCFDDRLSNQLSWSTIHAVDSQFNPSRMYSFTKVILVRPLLMLLQRINQTSRNRTLNNQLIRWATTGKWVT